jgi:hypothetical protein
MSQLHSTGTAPPRRPPVRPDPLAVALQVAFEKKQRLETCFSHFSRFKGLKKKPALSSRPFQPGAFNLDSPRTAAHLAAAARHDVALQVAFERQTLKPVFHLIG